MIKVVLFDLDGTLIDTNELVYKSFKHTFTNGLNLNLSDTEIAENYGRPLEESFFKYVKSKEEVEDLVNMYREYNLKIHDDLCMAFDGAEELLKTLKEQEIKVGIVTSKKGDVAERGLKVTGLLKYIDLLVSPEKTIKHKPEAEPVEYALKVFDVDKEEAIMVGDSPFDLLSGKNAGVKTCGVSYTAIDIHELKKIKPNYIIDDLRELIEIVKER